MTRQRARHRRQRMPHLRLGASILIPALVAGGTYVLLDDSSTPRTTTSGDRDSYSPPSVFTGLPTAVATTDETTPPTSTPSASPTDDPATTPSDSPEPTDESSPSPSDDPTTTEPDPTHQPPSDPPATTPDDPEPSKKPTSKPSRKPRVDLTSAEAAMLSVINDDRADAGCAAVEPDAALMDAARLHSADMAAEGDDSTEGSDGSSPQKRAYRAGYTGTVSEVVFDGLGWATLALLTNPLSRDDEAIITDCGYESIGIGAKEGVVKTYWTLDFGRS